MKIKIFIIFIFAFISTTNAKEKITGIGTPMLFPTIMGIANELKFSKNMPSPFIEIGATGFSFQIFCSGVGDNYPDFVNSSREISDKEADLCLKNNIEFGKINIEYDAIVIVTDPLSDLQNLTAEDLFNAISGYVFDQDGNLVKNNNRMWSHIRKDLPDEKIVFYGTALTSGTYDFLKEKIFASQCQKAKDKDPFKKYCGLARMDGRYVPVPGGYTMNIQKMLSRKGAVAMIPYIFLEKHYKRFKIIAVDNILPNDDNMQDYLLSRFLYVYYKKNSLNKVAHFKDFVNELKNKSISFEH